MVERAAKMFDRLIVAVARNTEKHSLFSADERIEMLKEITAKIPNVEITHFTGLIIALARERKAIATP